MSIGEEVLAWQLKAAGIDYEREKRFAPPRRWRFDFVLPYPGECNCVNIAVEVDGGSWSGGHRRGKQADAECEKLNTATLMGWRVLHVTPAMVDDGRALKVIEEALGRATTET